MSQFVPGSRSRVQMAEKAQIARRLLQQGLTIDQITIQLRCSRAFVTKVKKSLKESSHTAPPGNGSEARCA